MVEQRDETQILVLIIPNKDYQKRVTDLTKDIAKLSEKICYVSLNKPYKTLLKNFTDAGIDTTKFIFIDAITKTAEMPPVVENCEFVSSPGALTELSLAISNTLETKGVNLIVFDSLSTMLVYEDENIVTKFVHSLMAKIRVMGCRGIFTCLKQDSDTVLLKDVNMFADKIIDIDGWAAFR